MRKAVSEMEYIDGLTLLIGHIVCLCGGVILSAWLANKMCGAVIRCLGLYKTFVEFLEWRMNNKKGGE